MSYQKNKFISPFPELVYYEKEQNTFLRLGICAIIFTGEWRSRTLCSCAASTYVTNAG